MENDAVPTTAERKERIEKIRCFPEQLEVLVSGLSDDDLNTPYMAGEWTVSQNVHHVADSHMNAFIRFKLIYTEDTPNLKAYNQDLWAQLPDGHHLPLEYSLSILRGLHARWCVLLDQLSEEQWACSGLHPENGMITLDDILQTYAGHGEGHIDQIQRTLAAKPHA
jgi:hypothetical protein